VRRQAPRLGHRRLASDLLLPRHVVSSPPSVAPLLDLKRSRNLPPATCGFRWAENGHKPGSASGSSAANSESRNDTQGHALTEGDCVLDAYWYAQLTVHPPKTSEGRPDRNEIRRPRLVTTQE
jgi:hypothetical protein